MKTVNICVKSIQGKDTLLSHHNDRLKMCVDEVLALNSSSAYDYDGFDSLLHADAIHNLLF